MGAKPIIDSIMKKIIVAFILLLYVNSSVAQLNLKSLDVLIGHWQGTGTGFGNNTSLTKSSFTWVMNNSYIEVINESVFEPTDKKPKGEHHIDKGYISFDKIRKKIVFRQFNSEGYINQYVLDSESTLKKLVFKSENIENFMPGGSAEWIIEINDSTKLTTIFNVTFPKKEAMCFGTNSLTKKIQ